MGLWSLESWFESKPRSQFSSSAAQIQFKMRQIPPQLCEPSTTLLTTLFSFRMIGDTRQSGGMRGLAVIQGRLDGYKPSADRGREAEPVVEQTQAMARLRGARVTRCG